MVLELEEGLEGEVVFAVDEEEGDERDEDHQDVQLAVAGLLFMLIPQDQDRDDAEHEVGVRVQVAAVREERVDHEVHHRSLGKVLAVVGHDHRGDHRQALEQEHDLQFEGH